MRSRFLMLCALGGLLTACEGTSTSTEKEGQPQPLGTCMPGWWLTTPGSCAIEPACRQATGDLRTACEAADCVSVSFFGYAPESSGTYHQGSAIASESLRRFCARNVLSGTWKVSSETQLEVSLSGGPPQQLTSSCTGSDARVEGLARTRASSSLQEALGQRAAQGTWDACGY